MTLRRFSSAVVSQPLVAHPVNPDFVRPGAVVWMPHTGVFVGSQPTFSGQKFGSSPAGMAADISVTADRIQFSISDSIDVTLYAVFSPDVTTSGKVVLSAMGPSTRGHYLSIESGGVLSAVTTHDGSFSVASGRAVIANEETHVVGVFSGARRLVFINGVAYNANTASRNPTGITTFSIGVFLNAGAAASPLDGKVCLAGYLPNTITDAEAKQNSKNLWGAVFEPRRIWVPVSAAGSGTTFNPISGRGGAAAQPVIHQ